MNIPFKGFYSIAMIIVGVTTVLILLNIFLSTTNELESDYVNRVSFELAEGLMSSNITYKKGIFFESKLNDINGENKEPIRNCLYGYSVNVTAITDNGKRKWSFGYNPGWFNPKEKKTMIFPIGVLMDEGSGGEKKGFYPGKLKIEVRRDSFTELSCLMEDVFETSEAKVKELGCNSDNGFYYIPLSGSSVYCRFHVLSEDGTIVLKYYTLSESSEARRYMGFNVTNDEIDEKKEIGNIDIFDLGMLSSFPEGEMKLHFYKTINKEINVDIMGG